MKRIEAILRPETLEDVKSLLDSFKLTGLTIQQVMGCGTQRGWKEFVRGEEVDYNFLPKIKIELVVCDDKAEEVVDGIVGLAHTGEIGDGKIFISPVEDAVRIRTRERGEAAIR